MIRTCLLALCLAVANAGEDQRPWYDHQELLYNNIACILRFTPANEDVAKAIWQEWREINTVFNDYRDDSEIGRFNAGSDLALVCSPLMARAMTESQRMDGLSQGAFTVTVGPLRRLWKGAVTTGTVPSDVAIAAVLPLIGRRAYTFDGKVLTRKQSGVRFDFGGIVKGMAVDLAVERLTKAGATDFLVQIGGETAVRGTSMKNRPHRLGIPDARDPEAMWCVLQDPGTGLSGATSANYHQPIVIRGQSYFHIYCPWWGRLCVAAGRVTKVANIDLTGACRLDGAHG